MSSFRASFAATRPLWKSISFVLLFNGAFFLWVLLKPVTHALFVAVDDWGVTAGLLMMSLLCFSRIAKRWRQGPAAGAVKLWVPVLLSLGLLSYTMGQGIWTYYEQILHQLSPFPSWSDAGYLGVYPFVLVGILPMCDF